MATDIMQKKFCRLFLLISSLLFCIPCTPAREATHYTNKADGSVQCGLCPRACQLADGQSGVCRVRKNVKGTLQSLTYGRLCAMNTDPIEKKPLFHFLPGTETLSIASPGCNLRCVFCQNWAISQAEPSGIETVAVEPAGVVERAKSGRFPSISYTYSEPTTFFEYMCDTGFLARQSGIRNVWITCGYINPAPLAELCRVIDAANVDLKGFSDKAYRQMAGAKLAPVLETLKILRKNKVWVEVGYLVIPGVNDSAAETDGLVQWIKENLGPDVPLHFLRFFPQHKLTNLPPTPVQTLEAARAAAIKAGLHYVYIGNVPGNPGENTYCPKCGAEVIGRKGYFIERMNMKGGCCGKCGAAIAGVWK